MITIRRKPDFNKNHYEQIAWNENKLICGVDEVGRGCLAGPVVAAAVILKTTKISRLVKDSKLMTHDEHCKAFDWIGANAWFAVGIIHHRAIDQYNIYAATQLAMKRAITQLLVQVPQKPAFIVIDAMPITLNNFDGEIIAFPDGERKSSSIAAASIVAKVTRDALMQRLDTVFPGYALARHKGYATAEHRVALGQCPISLIHRISFLKSLHASDQSQLSLFDEEGIL
jgi:ribonuclease HII